MVKNQRWVFVKPFEGEAKVTNFELKEEDVPPIQDGEVLFEAVYLSVDPYMRGYADKLMGGATGYTMFGAQVARVLESKHKEFKVGMHVFGYFGWQLYTVVNPDIGAEIFARKIKPEILPDFGSLPVSLALGALGSSGNTAYFGFLEICNPKAGDVVVVSGAAGSVGSHVGQIAKIKGCYVIGIAGSDEKLAWLKNELNFDGVINYKTQDVTAELKKLAPKGVDCYFDNVGGELSSKVLYQMSKFGRVSMCGTLSAYNGDWSNLEKASIVQPAMIMNEVRAEGFFVSRWEHRWPEAVAQNKNWIKQGKLKYRETITEGFSQMPQALIKLLRGEGSGKAVVKV